jgi:hypothetical protein
VHPLSPIISHLPLSFLIVTLLTIYVYSFRAPDGRRPVYLTVLPIFTLGSLGVALARTVPQLMLFRVMQAFGGGGGMSVGAGVITDIYRLEERGSAIGFFFAVGSRPLLVIYARVQTGETDALLLFRRAYLAPRSPRYWADLPCAMRRGASCSLSWVRVARCCSPRYYYSYRKRAGRAPAG